jgi:uncharacterized protein YkwD
LRKLAAAALAVPIIAVLYAPVLVRRSIVARLGIAIAIGALIGVGALGILKPGGTVATPPAPAIVPLSPASFSSTISAKAALDAPITISFSAPMDPASVAASLDVSPKTAVVLSWDSSGTHLTVTPRSHWTPGAYHTLTVRPGALGQSGRPMAVPARAVFTTRSATVARLEATDLIGKQAKVGSAVRLTFDQAVAIGDVRRGLVTNPVIRGALDSVATPDGSTAFLFTPSSPLKAGTRYAISLVGVQDADGTPLAGSPSLTFTTTDAPRIVRFRPANGTKTIERGASLSVRFSESMDRASTKAAFSVTIGGKAIAGTVSFAEKNTVLVFKPKGAYPYGAKVQITVGAAALSATGAALERATAIQVTVKAKPKAKAAAPATKTSSGGGSSSGSGGKSVGGGSWGAVEVYYMKLMNCTRTGGWVTSSGACSSPGGRNVAALRLDSGISSKVSRPYAKKLAVGNDCSHFIGGGPDDRLRAAGYRNYTWAENIGCRSGNAYSAVLGSHLFFQDEKSTNGGHYVNLMNAKYDRAGVGVWVASGRVRLVVDFYHP